MLSMKPRAQTLALKFSKHDHRPVFSAGVVLNFLYLNGLRDRTSACSWLCLPPLPSWIHCIYDLGFKAPLIQRVIYALSRLRLSCCCWCSRYRLSHADMEEGSCSRYAALSTLLLLPPEVLEMVLPVAAASQGVRMCRWRRLCLCRRWRRQ
jgi:hypothetical protein